MEFKDNFGIFNLFLDKKVKVYADQKTFFVKVPTIREFNSLDYINSAYHLWNLPVSKMKQVIARECKEPLDFITNVIFYLGIYKEYEAVVKSFKSALEFYLPDLEIDYKNKQLIVGSTIITNEVWEYILYVLKLSCGEKVEKPRTFASEDERKFYLAQKEMDEKIKKIKAQKPGDSEGLIKAFLTIQYKFNLSFDYLAEQTLAQIQWLQGYAAGAVSYEVNAQAFAAGNMKKGKKLEFFIK